MRNVDCIYRRRMWRDFMSDRLCACVLIIITHLSLLIPHFASAQDLIIRDVFKQMPDSLMPYLTLNNRLDFIDFIDSGMKAEVTNRLAGTSEMTALTDDSLSIRMSDGLRVDLLLMTLDQPVDSVRQVVAFVETFLTDSLYGESTCRVYSTDWQPMVKDIPWNSAQQKRIASLKLQNILKWEDDILNNR